MHSSFCFSHVHSVGGIRGLPCAHTICKNSSGEKSGCVGGSFWQIIDLLAADKRIITAKKQFFTFICIFLSVIATFLSVKDREITVLLLRKIDENIHISANYSPVVIDAFPENDIHTSISIVRAQC